MGFPGIFDDKERLFTIIYVVFRGCAEWGLSGMRLVPEEGKKSMNRIFGCSTFGSMDHPLVTTLEEISLRTDWIEILSEGQHDLFRHKEDCCSFSARFSVHAPCADLNIASTRERIRTGSIGVIDDICKICDDIDAKTLVVHPGHCAWEPVRDESWSSLMRSLGDLACVQEDHGVKITLENMGSWECCHFRTPVLLERIKGQGLGFTLDVGHAYLNHVLEDFTQDGNPDHVHLHDNLGECDDHAACGSGVIDFNKVLRNLPKNIPLVLECRDLSSYDQSVRYLRTLGI